ncbi:hypothetical protein [Flavobacterium sp. CHNK8]|nr:hypothetical protein [Flavobacterium sp. CHNK8]
MTKLIINAPSDNYNQTLNTYTNTPDCSGKHFFIKPHFFLT